MTQPVASRLPTSNQTQQIVLSAVTNILSSTSIKTDVSHERKENDVCPHNTGVITPDGRKMKCNCGDITDIPEPSPKKKIYKW